VPGKRQAGATACVEYKPTGQDPAHKLTNKGQMLDALQACLKVSLGDPIVTTADDIVRIHKHEKQGA
jgi:hypothetical protein